MLDARILLPIVLLVATAAYLWAALGIHSAYEDEGVGPSFFPIVIVCIMAPALLWILAQGVRTVRADVRGESHRMADPAKIVALTALYVALFVPLGYFVATLLYVLGLFLVFDLGTRNPLRIAGTALAIFLLVSGWIVVEEAARWDERTTSTLQLPLWIYYLSLPVGAALLAFHFAVRTLRIATGAEQDTLAHHEE